MQSETSSLPYHEPGITTILIQSSFLILLNVLNSIFDQVLYCGLIAQILLGIAWGTPGSKWLESSVETAITQLGYLGLLLLVYEGGLSTSLKSLKANIWFSVAVATTGISMPIGLSFFLMRLTNATPLQCFAAGASLSSTSLGTTFTLLGTSGLTKSRLGVVLTSAAMMDDVVGLVLVQVISNFGKEGSSVTAAIVVRPLLISIAFIILAPLSCVFIIKPLTRRINQFRTSSVSGTCNHMMASKRTALLTHTLILLGCVAGAGYAGTSNLFSAYIAGASISWWDTGVEHLTNANEPEARASSADANVIGHSVDGEIANSEGTEALSGLRIYERFFLTPVDRILKPFFFASIGFSIPVTKMFSGDIVWKGIVYAMLMILAKLACGIWVARISVAFPLSWKSTTKSTRPVFRNMINSSLGRIWATKATEPTKKPPVVSPTEPMIDAAPQTCASNLPLTGTIVNDQAAADGKRSDNNSTRNGKSDESNQDEQNVTLSATSKPQSLYPASIIGCAMVARGEIGFLISSIAESNDVFSTSSGTDGTSDIFLIVTWAIVLCTILGPVVVGLLVQRVKKLQNGVQREGQTVHRDVLGVWGIS
ncbi:hypothetical protein EsDP_00007272 [Epichloe bromicola]|uniref:Cation/H+ exchanger transmembrane domain-containing protein n=1 Tax=Epichloe bromicola TaxID=79588 RepID=A0ABQ0D033_9HYPO